MRRGVVLVFLFFLLFVLETAGVWSKGREGKQRDVCLSLGVCMVVCLCWYLFKSVCRLIMHVYMLSFVAPFAFKLRFLHSPMHICMCGSRVRV